ncbi:MAG: TlyA family RNA methyltransferase [Polyangiaceae bacterium]|nr:TlyA family RNA methyltransferase [Polyangiaceae bacterium]MCL4752961.1 TlyA family RNA methyltransferase [Myxococcales bacterium]
MKLRADVALVERALAASRTQAQALILAGRVFSGERRVEKAGELLADDAELQVRGAPRFVSRGGDKLEGALTELAVDVADQVVLDIGASTGGFTDCVLQHGASRVYAVDVGHGQLAQKLRADPRVVVMERTNARHLSAASFPEPIGLVVVDASFIGIEKLMPAISAILPRAGRLLALVKPQFEAGRDAARRARGVIRDPEVRSAAIAEARAAIEAAGFDVLSECDSRVAGPKGNVERFVLATRLA